MRNHLQLWLQIRLGGSRQAPRQLPREPETVEIHIQGLAPVVQGWVEAGRQSFAEISEADILAALATLPAGTTHRHSAEIGLKSLFTILTGRRLVFTTPLQGVPLTHVPTTLPLPLAPPSTPPAPLPPPPPR